jgi:hypothetical protein
MVTWLARLFSRPRDSSPAALEAFLARQSAFVTQKTVLDYCRVKTGRAERQAFADPDFVAALTHCRWQTYAATVQDITALAEAWLRPHAAGAEPRLAEALARLGDGVLEAAPAPPDERASIEEARMSLPHRLAVLQAAAPIPAHKLPLLAEAPLFATLPFGPEQRIGESASIRGALRFHVVSSQQELERAFDAPALARRLTMA